MHARTVVPVISGDVRNDLYLTLNCGQFERGNKTAGKNVEVKVGVFNNKGEPLQVRHAANKTCSSLAAPTAAGVHVLEH